MKRIEELYVAVEEYLNVPSGRLGRILFNAMLDVLAEHESKITELKRLSSSGKSEAVPDPPRFEGYEWVRKGKPKKGEYYYDNPIRKIIRTDINFDVLEEDIYRLILGAQHERD